MKRGSCNTLNILLLLTNMIGLFLSFYAYHVETQFEHNNKYEAMCDINEFISCTKAFSSEYGKGFGIVHKLVGEDSIFHQPNSVYGLFFHSILCLLSLFNTTKSTKLLVLLSVVANFGSLYLAYILYILKDICVVCVGTYIVNFTNLILSVIKLNTIKSKRPIKKD